MFPVSVATSGGRVIFLCFVISPRHFCLIGTINQAELEVQASSEALATFASALLSLAGGITFGYTAVLLPQLENDESFPYDKSYDSWIASIAPLAMMMGCIFSGTMSDALGRKTGMLILIFPYSIGWVVMAFANNTTILLLGRFITGICTGAVRPLSMVYIGELTSPKYRSITLFCPSMAIHFGTFMSHTIGSYMYWKRSCFIFILPNVVCVLILLCMKESPLWLIAKGKSEEGIESFKFFRGDGEDAEKELALVLEKNKDNAEKATFKDTLDILLSKPFIKSLATILSLFIAVQWSGINTLSFYAQTIFEKTFSGDVDAYLLMLGTDGMRMIGSMFLCVFARFLPRKITFLFCSYGTTVVLICLVIYLYMKPVGLVALAITIMVIYMALATVLTSISWSFVAEIFPARVRGFGSGLSSFMSFGLLFGSVKVAPSIIASYGEAVMFAVFAIVTLISAIILSFILPETNGRSLQEIENTMYNKKKVGNNDIPLDAKSPDPTPA